MLTRPLAATVRLFAVVALLLGVGFLSPSAADPKMCGVVIGGKIVYHVCDPGSTHTDPPTGGGDHKPPCDLTHDPYDEFCDGTAACWGNNPAANSAEDVADELGPKPDDPDAHVAYKSCRRADGSTYDDWYWATAEDGATLNELAQRAYGQLTVPAFAPTFNPPTATYVNLDTWWWARGATNNELIGTAALGVRAIAKPNHMEVDPGDGSGAFTCRFTTHQADDCTYTYRRASNHGSARAPDGNKAYPARMRLVYDVHFEINGAPLPMAGLPTDFSSDWTPVAVPVREVQTVVVPGR